MKACSCGSTGYCGGRLTAQIRSNLIMIPAIAVLSSFTIGVKRKKDHSGAGAMLGFLSLFGILLIFSPVYAGYVPVSVEEIGYMFPTLGSFASNTLVFVVWGLVGVVIGFSSKSAKKSFVAGLLLPLVVMGVVAFVLSGLPLQNAEMMLPVSVLLGLFSGFVSTVMVLITTKLSKSRIDWTAETATESGQAEPEFVGSSESLKWCPKCRKIVDWEGWEDLVNMADYAESESLKSGFAFDVALNCKLCEYKKKVRFPEDIPAILKEEKEKT